MRCPLGRITRLSVPIAGFHSYSPNFALYPNAHSKLSTSVQYMMPRTSIPSATASSICSAEEEGGGLSQICGCAQISRHQEGSSMTESEFRYLYDSSETEIQYREAAIARSNTHNVTFGR